MASDQRDDRSALGMATRFLSVFVLSVLACGGLALWGLIAPTSLTRFAKGMTDLGLRHFDWLFLSSCSLFVVLVLAIAFSRLGRLKLGRPDEKPEFDLASWLAMLFAAGMGAGLLFWGAAEPVTHFLQPPPVVEDEKQAARYAMIFTNFHWGLHAWGIYAMGSLVLAYFGFRLGYPLLPGAPLRATMDNRLGRVLGDLSDIVAVLAVVFGVAGSLGAGVVQVGAGLHIVFGTPDGSMMVWAIILVVLTISYMLSAGTSLDKGIRILSNINMGTAVVLMLFVLFVGPTAFILRTWLTSTGDYLASLVPLSTNLFHYTGESQWSRNWSLTYFIWWVSWTPFVGIFVARISRGRTIREFVMGVVFVPTLFSLLWFAVFGGTGLHIELFGDRGFGSLVAHDVSAALFGLFDYFPASFLLSFVSLFLIFIFLVTSADSASFVLGMITSGGSPNPVTWRKLLWAVVIAALTASALFAGGDILVMRTIAVSGAIPFVIIMLVQVMCLLNAFRHDPEIEKSKVSSSSTKETETDSRVAAIPQTEASS